MITYLQFIEELNKIHTKLEVSVVDDDPTKIYARAMIRDMKDNYQAIINEHEQQENA